MPQREIDSPSIDGAQLVASLLARIDGLIAQIAARDERIDELLAQVKALNARIAELEAERGGPPSRRRSSSGARAGPASRASWPRIPTRRNASSLSTVPAAPFSAKPDRNSRRSTIILTFRRSGQSRRASSCSAPPAPAATRGGRRAPPRIC